MTLLRSGYLANMKYAKRLVHFLQIVNNKNLQYIPHGHQMATEHHLILNLISTRDQQAMDLLRKALNYQINVHRPGKKTAVL